MIQAGHLISLKVFVAPCFKSRPDRGQILLWWHLQIFFTVEGQYRTCDLSQRRCRIIGENVTEPGRRQLVDRRADLRLWDVTRR